MIVVVDTGGIDDLAPFDERRRARLRAIRERASDIIVPAGVLAEGVLGGHPGRDHHVRRLLASVDIAPLDEPLGYAAGALRRAAIEAGRGAPPPSGVDAAVVAEADARASADEVCVITSGAGDIGALAALAPNATRLSVLAP